MASRQISGAKLFSGTHIELPEVDCDVNVGRVSIEPLDEKGGTRPAPSQNRMLVETDGELIGTIPAQFEIVKGAITLF